MNRGEVWRVNCDPSVGQEFQKVRYAVLISEDWVRGQQVRVLVPFTGWKEHLAKWPWMVRVHPTPENGLAKVSAANPLQVKSFSTERLIERVGALSAEDFVAVLAALALVVGLPGPEASA